MKKIKIILFVAFFASIGACTPEYIEPISQLRSENDNVRLGSVSSLNDNEPVVVVDGRIVEKDALLELNPDEIESMSVFKNKVVAALYGERGKNGVIVIKLKK